jgi:hypothetical protein
MDAINNKPNGDVASLVHQEAADVETINKPVKGDDTAAQLIAGQQIELTDEDVRPPPINQ